MVKGIEVPVKEIEILCQKWKIKEFSFFGSVLTDQFTPESDVDVMVEFFKDASWSLLDIASLQEELKTLFNRDVDLLEKDVIRNPFRRKEIMDHYEVVYAA